MPEFRTIQEDGHHRAFAIRLAKLLKYNILQIIEPVDLLIVGLGLLEKLGYIFSH